MSSSKGIKKNISITMLVQVISFTVSLIMNLFLPKYISVIEYSYWQTFLLYVAYIPLLHFGFPGGLLLHYAQYDYENLDKPLIRSLFTVFFVVELFFSVIIVVISKFVENDVAKTILLFMAITVVLNNVFLYTSYTFQLTNRISKYAILILCERLVLGVGVVFLIVLNKASLINILCIYTGASVVANLWGYCNNKDLYFGSVLPIKKTLTHLKKILSSGIMLLIAALSSNFIVGGAKMVIQWHYDAFLFGQLSFAFSVSNLFLSFVAAASIALFPSIKRIEQEKLPYFYENIRKKVSVLLFVVLFFYFPGCKVLQLWLPNYSGGLIYLGILMPIIVFSSKVTLLTDNYLKAYRREKLMFCINVISVTFAFSTYLVCVYLLDNLTALFFSLIAVVMLKSIVSEIFVMKLINKNFSKDFIVEFFMTIVFIFSTMNFSLLYGGIFYFIVLSCFVIWKTDFVEIKKRLKMSLHR